MLLVDIIPLRRVPKALRLLTYSADTEIKDQLQVGSIVKVPFRKSNCFGLVLATHDAKQIPENVKPIEKVILSTPLLTQDEIASYKHVGDIYNVSYGEIIKKALPPIQVRKLAKESFNHSTIETCKHSTQRQYELYRSPEEHSNAVQNHISGRTLILVPEIHLQKKVQKLLSEYKERVILFDGDMTNKELFSAWFRIAHDLDVVVIGTRNAVFLPLRWFHSIIVDFEHDSNHKHWDQAPRFHVHDVLELRKEEIQCPVTFMSFSPSLESYTSHYDGTFNNLNKNQVLFESGSKARIIDLRDERKAQNYSLFSNYVQELLQQENHNILFFLNRKGFATSIGCNQCGQVVTCQTCILPFLYIQSPQGMHCHNCKIHKPMQHHCDTCNGMVMELRGAGTEQVENQLRKARRNKETRVLRVDGNLDESASFDPSAVNWVVGTSKVFSALDISQFQTIVFLDIDKLLHIPEYDATNQAWHTLQHALHFKDKSTDVVVQTHSPDHFLIKSIPQPDRFYRTELVHRKSLGYPPYMYVTRYFYGNRDANKAQEIAESAYKTVQNALTQAKKRVMVNSPIEMHPKYFRGMYFYCIIVKIEPKNAFSDIIWLNQFFGTGWKVDPRPNSLLSP